MVLSLIVIDAFLFYQTESGCLIKMASFKLNLLTSRGRHTTGIRTKESVYSVGLEAAWECLWKKLTGNSEDISLDLSGDVHATSPLGVVCPTQAGHVGHAALMDVHHTVCRQKQRKVESTHPLSVALSRVNETGAHTFTSHALVYEAVEQRTTVVAEGRAGVGVNLKLVLCSWVLKGTKEDDKFIITILRSLLTTLLTFKIQ